MLAEELGFASEIQMKNHAAGIAKSYHDTIKTQAEPESIAAAAFYAAYERRFPQGSDILDQIKQALKKSGYSPSGVSISRIHERIVFHDLDDEDIYR